MATITNNLIEAIEIIAKNEVNKTDQTSVFIATIKKCNNAETGEYYVENSVDSVLAYDSSKNNYSIGQEVYVLKTSDSKIPYQIIGAKLSAAKPTTTTSLVSSIGNYDIIGKNALSFVADNNDKKVYSMKSKETTGETEEIDEDDYSLDENNDFKNSLNEATHIMLTAEFKNSFTSLSQYGDYGIIVALTYKKDSAELINTYTLSVNEMTGDPYKYSDYSLEYAIFEKYSGDYTFDSLAIYYYYKGFVESGVSDAAADIFIRDIGLYALSDDLVNKDNYYLYTAEENGITYPLSDKSITVKCDLKYKKATNVNDNAKFYWGVKNSNIKAGESTTGYNVYLGNGYEFIETSTDQKNNNKITIDKKYCSGYATEFKCVAIYNDDISISKTFNLYNNNENNELQITCETGSSYTASDNYTITLIASCKNKTANYKWFIGEEEKTGSGDYKQILSFDLSTISAGGYTTVKCEAYSGSSESEQIIGTEYYTITKSTVIPQNYVIINNGDQAFQYNENGISPASSTLGREAISVSPLAVTLYKPSGDVVDSSTFTKVEWKIPKDNTLIQAPTSNTSVEDDYIIYESSSYPLAIVENYNAAYTNNTIIAVITIGEDKYYGETHFNFARVGSPGTNGTKNVLNIVPQGSSGTTNHDLAMIHDSTWHWSYDEGSFKAELYNNGKEVSATSYTWGFATPNGAISKDFKLSATSGDTITVSHDTVESGINTSILKAGATYNNSTVYTQYPLPTINYAASGYANTHNISILSNQTLQNILYSAAGANPQYDATKGVGLSIINSAAGTNASNYTIEWSTVNAITNSSTNCYITISRYQDEAGEFSISSLSFDATMQGYIATIAEAIKDNNETNIKHVSTINGYFKDQANSYEKTKSLVETYVKGLSSEPAVYTNAYKNILSTKANTYVYKNYLYNNGDNPQTTDVCFHRVYVKPAAVYAADQNYNIVRAIVKTADTSTLIATVDVPINMTLNTYELSNLNAWDGTSVTIDNSGGYILSPQIGAGHKDLTANTFTGIIMGDFKNGTVTNTGLLGYNNGQQSIYMNAADGSVELGLSTTDSLSHNGKIKLVPNGVSTIAGWNIANNLLYSVEGEGFEATSLSEFVELDEDSRTNASKFAIQYNHSGAIVSGTNKPYISLKTKQLGISELLNVPLDPYTLSYNDSLEARIDPDDKSIFSIIRNTESANEEQVGNLKLGSITGDSKIIESSNLNIEEFNENNIKDYVLFDYIYNSNNELIPYNTGVLEGLVYNSSSLINSSTLTFNSYDGLLFGTKEEVTLNVSSGTGNIAFKQDNKYYSPNNSSFSGASSYTWETNNYSYIPTFSKNQEITICEMNWSRNYSNNSQILFLLTQELDNLYDYETKDYPGEGATGTKNVLYVDSQNSKTYCWNGKSFEEIQIKFELKSLDDPTKTVLETFYIPFYLKKEGWFSNLRAVTFTCSKGKSYVISYALTTNSLFDKNINQKCELEIDYNEETKEYYINKYSTEQTSVINYPKITYTFLLGMLTYEGAYNYNNYYAELKSRVFYNSATDKWETILNSSSLNARLQINNEEFNKNTYIIKKLINYSDEGEISVSKEKVVGIDEQGRFFASPAISDISVVNKYGKLDVTKNRNLIHYGSSLIIGNNSNKTNKEIFKVFADKQSNSNTTYITAGSNDSNNINVYSREGAITLESLSPIVVNSTGKVFSDCLCLNGVAGEFLINVSDIVLSNSRALTESTNVVSVKFDKLKISQNQITSTPSIIFDNEGITLGTEELNEIMKFNQMNVSINGGLIVQKDATFNNINSLSMEKVESIQLSGIPITMTKSNASTNNKISLACADTYGGCITLTSNGSDYTRVGLYGNVSWGGHIKITNSDKNAIVRLGNYVINVSGSNVPQGGYVNVYTNAGNKAASVYCTKADGGQIAIYNATGAIKAIIGADPNFGSYIKLYRNLGTTNNPNFKWIRPDYSTWKTTDAPS